MYDLIVNLTQTVKETVKLEVSHPPHNLRKSRFVGYQITDQCYVVVFLDQFFDYQHIDLSCLTFNLLYVLVYHRKEAIVAT